MMQARALPPERKWTKAEMPTLDKLDAVKVPSPCISICQMDVLDEVCVGCYRTRTEIAEWGNMDQDDQILLLDILRERRAKATGVLKRASPRKKKRLSI
ncbi:MAG: DUF1289 domain-containing protein [Candidatus Puniceispirillaceae bacterium]